MSSIKYHVQSRKSPASGEVLYYASSSPQELVTEEEIILQISQKTTVSRADVLAVLAALQEEIRFNLVNGRKVKLNDVGTFRSSIRSLGSVTDKDVTPACIQGCRVVFTPARTIRAALKPGTPGVYFSVYKKNDGGTAPSDPGTGGGGEQTV